MLVGLLISGAVDEMNALDAKANVRVWKCIRQDTGFTPREGRLSMTVCQQCETVTTRRTLGGNEIVVNNDVV